MKERCELFQKEMERFSKKRLGLDGEKKESKAKKIVSVVGPMTNFLIDIGGRLAIIVSVPTLGIVTAFAGAALAAVTRTVTINDYRNNSKTRSKVKELYKVDPVSMILTILKEVGIELSRIFEEQLFTLRDNKDVTVLACCAVNLMLKFKGSEKFDRNTLLRNVLLGKAKTNPKVKMRNNKSLRAQDFFQQTGLRKVSLRGSEFKETYLSHCNLTGVNAQSCTWTTTKVLHSCADDADLRCGVNGVGGNSWEGTSLENAQVKGEPSREYFILIIFSLFPHLSHSFLLFTLSYPFIVSYPLSSAVFLFYVLSSLFIFSYSLLPFLAALILCFPPLYSIIFFYFFFILPFLLLSCYFSDIVLTSFFIFYFRLSTLVLDYPL